MPLPQMHGRTHIPAGYAAVVQASDGTDHLEQASSDQIPTVLSTASGDRPVFTARQNAAFTTVTDGSDTALLWDQWDTGFNTAVFGVTLSGGKVSTVSLKQLPGLYSLTCGVQWAVNWNADARIILAGDYDFNQEQDFVGRAGGWTGNITASFTLIFEAPFEATDSAAAVQWQVVQHSGVSRDTDFGTQMQIHYLGAVDAGGF